MKRISRYLLGMVTTIVPVVIAACYGMAYQFSQRGKVVDKSTKTGVAGLRVECLSQSGSMTDETHTLSDGSFGLYATSAAACTTIAVDDDRESGARYAATKAAPNPSQDIVIEVNPL